MSKYKAHDEIVVLAKARVDQSWQTQPANMKPKKVSHPKLTFLSMLAPIQTGITRAPTRRFKEDSIGIQQYH
jgi:hypothetical protein